MNVAVKRYSDSDHAAGVTEVRYEGTWLVITKVSLSTGCPIEDARLLKYLKSKFSKILPSLGYIGRKFFFNFEKRASFLG